MAEHSPVATIRHASNWSIIWGVLLIVFGMLAIGSPFLAAVAVAAVIAWLIIFAAFTSWSWLLPSIGEAFLSAELEAAWLDRATLRIAFSLSAVRFVVVPLL